MYPEQNTILDSINEGVFTVDLQWRITSFNRAAEEITGVSREDAIGQRCSEIMRTTVCESGCVLRRVMQTKKAVTNLPVTIVDAWGDTFPVLVSAAKLKDAQGNVIGGVETFQDLRLIQRLHNRKPDAFSDIIGQSAAMTRVFDLLPPVADSNVSVLIQGESGVGKELVARAIHALSPRRKKRFVALNCSALPDSLLESELFGYKAGAFTDAKKDKPGRFSLADQGTLFLDEIGDISPAMQARLLRVLQEKTYEPLGSVQTYRTDARIIAATNRNLEELVQQERFREDLYYRIRVVQIDVPPLRKRTEDIPLLVQDFIDRHNRTATKPILGISEEVIKHLQQHPMPGNVRQLHNILAHAFVLTQTGQITMEHLPQESRIQKSDQQKDDAKNTLQQTQIQMIQEALQSYQGNRAKAAKHLGIHVSTLYRLIKRHQLDTPPMDGRGKTNQNIG